jgi:hypothetical protein
MLFVACHGTTPLPGACPRGACADAASDAPVDADALTGDLAVVGEDLPFPAPDAGQPPPDANADLAELGQDSAWLVITPVRQFFTALAAMTSGPMTFTVANIGEISTGAVVVTFGGAAPELFTTASNGCVGPLPAAGRCKIEVVFKPRDAGDRNATLTVSAYPGGTALAELTGGALAIDELIVSPAWAEFGSVAVGATSSPMTIVVKSEFHVPVGPFQVGTSSPEFVVTGGTCANTVVPPYGTCTALIVFAPTSPGKKEAQVSVMGSNPFARGYTSLSGSAP